jgi:hypothetical protein
MLKEQGVKTKSKIQRGKTPGIACLKISFRPGSKGCVIFRIGTLAENRLAGYRN